MAFNADFTISESLIPNVFTISDTSTGSDSNLTGRTIFLYKSNGELLVAGISWPIAQASLTLDVLDRDKALDIQVQWASSSPLASPSTYTAKELFAFTARGEAFNYRLIQLQSANPSIIQSDDYLIKKMQLRIALDDAKDAIEKGADIYSAQQMIERSNFLQNNDRYFY